MVDWINYSNTNATDLTGNLQHTATIVQEATGENILFNLMLVSIFIGTAAFGSRYGFERSALFASILTLFTCFGMVAAGILNPTNLMLWIVLTGLFYFVEA